MTLICSDNLAADYSSGIKQDLKKHSFIDCRFIKNKSLIIALRNKLNYREMKKVHGSNEALFIDYASIVIVIKENSIDEVITIMPILNNAPNIIGEVVTSITIENMSSRYDVVNYVQNCNDSSKVHISNPVVNFNKKNIHFKYLSIKTLLKHLHIHVQSKKTENVFYYLIPHEDLIDLRIIQEYSKDNMNLRNTYSFTKTKKTKVTLQKKISGLIKKKEKCDKPDLNDDLI